MRVGILVPMKGTLNCSFEAQLHYAVIVCTISYGLLPIDRLNTSLIVIENFMQVRRQHQGWHLKRVHRSFEGVFQGRISRPLSDIWGND